MKFKYIAIIALYVYTPYVTSKSHCIGTCYSGKLFPEPKDIFHGKHLKGYSYNNITTDNPVKCYSSCVQDCRCKACQMKDARCELLDEDKTSKALKTEPGYVYFDLKQTMYEVKSHMIPPGVCYNGCCRSQPCMNGGTCEEHCKSPKEKFTCNCSVWYHGKVCEKKYPSSCLEILQTSQKGAIPANGNYTIMLANNLKLRLIYCAFVAPNKAWTLMESFSLVNNNIFKSAVFHKHLYENSKEPNWERYRLGYNFFVYFHSMSSMFRVTCDFPNRGGILTPDYVFGYLSDYDIFKYGDNGIDGKCFKFAHINIRGHDFFNVSALPIHLSKQYHFHIECGRGSCRFDVPGDIYSEDCFGFYEIQNPESKCNEKPESTTQFWLGQEL